MNHDRERENRQELAALYALDALSQSQARSFEQIVAEGDRLSEQEWLSFQAVVGDLGLVAEMATPRHEVKEDLFARITQTAIESPEDARFVSIRHDEGEWVECIEGVLRKTLWTDEQNGKVTALFRMLPGTQLPPHSHLGVEQFFVLEGDCNVNGQELGPGDYHRAAAGSRHESTHTKFGTTFLLIAPAEYRFQDEASAGE